jgi:hypothetical protein
LATFSIAASMALKSIVVVGVASGLPAAAEPPAIADPTCSIPVIPAAAWPAMVHTMS